LNRGRHSDVFSPVDASRGEDVLVDFGDPNATKPLHLGHLRNYAVGHALAQLWEKQGARVVRQSVVCDTGRVMAEAMAGYSIFADTLEEEPKGPAHFVGACYARYVQSIEGPKGELLSAGDEHIEREFWRSDLADSLLEELGVGSGEATELALRLSGMALRGQTTTLTRLGISVDRTLRESNYVDLARNLLAVSLRSGLFRQRSDGWIGFDTGTQELPFVRLQREGGFPTEHMRGLTVWHELYGELAQVARCLHVMGTEWGPATAARELMLRRLNDDKPIPTEYRQIRCGMVTYDGKAIKSSLASDLLIDSVLVAAVNAVTSAGLAEATSEAEFLARVIVVADLLDRDTSSPVEVGLSGYLDDGGALGWTVARAMAACRHAGPTNDPEPGDEFYRYMVLQAQRLPGLIAAAAYRCEPSLITRFIRHVAKFSIQDVEAPRRARLTRILLCTALAAIGLSELDGPQSEHDNERVSAENEVVRVELPK
jgi:hypothetical protein